MNFFLPLAVCTATLIHVGASAQNGNVCKTEQAAMNSIDAKYKPEYSSIEQRGNALGNQAPKDGDKISFNVKVDMKEQKWILKLPSITMKRNEIVIGLPQTTMKLQNWSYDLPETRMERRKTGQYPQFTCKKDNWGIPYDCRTTWSDTFADVPVTTLVRKEVKLDIPEVTWKDKKMSWDIPNLTWVENTWVVKVPEFTLMNVAVEKGKDLKSKSDVLSQDISIVNARRVSDSQGATRALYGCFRENITLQQTSMENEIDAGINTLSSSIQSIRAQGADPTKLPSDGSKAIDLVATLADMVSKRKAASDSFVTARTQLDQAEKDGLSKLQ